MGSAARAAARRDARARRESARFLVRATSVNWCGDTPSAINMAKWDCERDLVVRLKGSRAGTMDCGVYRGSDAVAACTALHGATEDFVMRTRYQTFLRKLDQEGGVIVIVTVGVKQ